LQDLTIAVAQFSTLKLSEMGCHKLQLHT
jgi:hypothetical protein